ncbi:molybdopterin converting factor subunit 1 [Pseudoduganella sp. LjRoot289]|uniref:molybdopterin converting factor subunit 1 n=1 Tax=Pseudoduganella sp. LjRoot289 TaxID=3342314 RepID=UPI003ED0BAA6
MNVTLKFFASVREAVGTSTEVLELPEGVATVGGIRALLISRGGAWAQALGEGRALRMACNQVMCQPGTLINEGAEVAFFPPVTGG